MRPIDGDAAVRLLRKYDMYDAAELIKELPRLRRGNDTKITRVISGFLASGRDKLELDTSGYQHAPSCYQVYRSNLRRHNITECYVYMEEGRVFLARVPGRATDGETANIRN